MLVSFSIFSGQRVHWIPDIQRDRALRFSDPSGQSMLAITAESNHALHFSHVYCFWDRAG